jgi:hypothetical protein
MNLTRYAAKYHTSVSDLVSTNTIPHPDIIIEGHPLIVPIIKEVTQTLPGMPTPPALPFVQTGFSSYLEVVQQVALAHPWWVAGAVLAGIAIAGSLLYLIRSAFKKYQKKRQLRSLELPAVDSTFANADRSQRTYLPLYRFPHRVRWATAILLLFSFLPMRLQTAFAAPPAKANASSISTGAPAAADDYLQQIDAGMRKADELDKKIKKAGTKRKLPVSVGLMFDKEQGKFVTGGQLRGTPRL